MLESARSGEVYLWNEGLAPSGAGTLSCPLTRSVSNGETCSSSPVPGASLLSPGPTGLVACLPLPPCHVQPWFCMFCIPEASVSCGPRLWGMFSGGLPPSHSLPTPRTLFAANPFSSSYIDDPPCRRNTGNNAL